MQKGKVEQKREKKIPVAVRLSFAAPRFLMPGNAASISTSHRSRALYESLYMHT